MLTERTLLGLRLHILFVCNRDGRLVYVNEVQHPEEHPAPLVYIGRNGDAVVWSSRCDLPASFNDTLEGVVRTRAFYSLDRDRELDAIVLDLLQAQKRSGLVYSGPAYRFPDRLPVTRDCVVVTSGNTSVLQGVFDDVRSHVEHVEPCVVALSAGQAVSVCHTVRRSDYALEAGVETLPAYRCRGYGTQVVAKWASLVRHVGLEPLYSTSWDNTASLAIAARLKLLQYATDFSVSSKENMTVSQQDSG